MFVCESVCARFLRYSCFHALTLSLPILELLLSIFASIPLTHSSPQANSTHLTHVRALLALRPTALHCSLLGRIWRLHALYSSCEYLMMRKYLHANCFPIQAHSKCQSQNTKEAAFLIFSHSLVHLSIEYFFPPKMQSRAILQLSKNSTGAITTR